jgi:hypothetical protein
MRFDLHRPAPFCEDGFLTGCHPLSRAFTSSLPPLLPKTSQALLPRPSNKDIVMTGGLASTHPSTPATPAEPPSPVPTEIATDLPIIELTPEEHKLSLHAAGIKVRDFAYELLPNSCKVPEVSDPVLSPIAAERQGCCPSAALAFQGVVPHLSSDHTTLSDAIR